MENAKQCLEYLVKLIVEDEDAVKVESSQDEMGILLSLHVAREDMGKVIGKGGATAGALRTLIRVIGSSEKASVSVKIIEPEGSTYVRPERPEGESYSERVKSEKHDE